MIFYCHTWSSLDQRRKEGCWPRWEPTSGVRRSVRAFARHQTTTRRGTCLPWRTWRCASCSSRRPRRTRRSWARQRRLAGRSACDPSLVPCSRRPRVGPRVCSGRSLVLDVGRRPLPRCFPPSQGSNRAASRTLRERFLNIIIYSQLMFIDYNVKIQSLRSSFSIWIVWKWQINQYSRLYIKCVKRCLKLLIIQKINIRWNYFGIIFWYFFTPFHSTSSSDF